MSDTPPNKSRGFFLQLHIIRPERDLVEMGVNFTDVTEEGMVKVYEYGMEKGREFVDTWNRNE
jgi:hypothetical protein